MSYDYITKFDSPNYTPADQCPHVFGRARTIDGVTIHHWGDPATRPSFDGVIAELCRRNNGDKSAHHVIEAGRVACLVNLTDAAWHAGSGIGNATTVGLELNPLERDGDYQTAAEVIAAIRAKYGANLPLYPHHHWVPTACPGTYDLGRLDRMADAVTAGGDPAPSTPSKPAPTTGRPVLRLGDHGRAVRNLQRFMMSVFPAYAGPIKNSGGADGSYGTHTRAVMREFQRRAKNDGVYRDAVDGITGPHTWAALDHYGYGK